MDCMSKTPNAALMAQTRASLKGLWGLSAAVTLIYAVISGGIGSVPLLGGIASILIGGAMDLGLVFFVLAVSRKQNPKISQLFKGFNKFGVALAAFILRAIFILLWGLLLIIPGIVAGLSYAMTFYILAENDSMGPLEAIKKSKEMMRGNRWKFFCLGCRFIGWLLLCVLTLGIGFFWLVPYWAVSCAKFYDDLVKKETV